MSKPDRVTYRQVFRRIPSAVRSMNRDEKSILVVGLFFFAAGVYLVIIGDSWLARAAGILLAGQYVMLVFVTLAASGYRRAFEQIRDGRDHYREN